MGVQATSDDAVYDMARLNSILQSELTEYMEDVPVSMTTKCLNRGALISWLCVLAPEAIDELSRLSLDKACGFLSDSLSEQKPWLWLRELPLRIAQYGISGDYARIKDYVGELSCGGSGTRFVIMDSLALVADKLDVQDENVRFQVELNRVRLFCI